jgi:hypothetical protein
MGHGLQGQPQHAKPVEEASSRLLVRGDSRVPAADLHRYVVLPKDFEKGYKSSVKKGDTEFAFYT